MQLHEKISKLEDELRGATESLEFDQSEFGPAELSSYLHLLPQNFSKRHSRGQITESLKILQEAQTVPTEVSTQATSTCSQLLPQMLECGTQFVPTQTDAGTQVAQMEFHDAASQAEEPKKVYTDTSTQQTVNGSDVAVQATLPDEAMMSGCKFLQDSVASLKMELKSLRETASQQLRLDSIGPELLRSFSSIEAATRSELESLKQTHAQELLNEREEKDEFKKSLDLAQDRVKEKEEEILELKIRIAQLEYSNKRVSEPKLISFSSRMSPEGSELDVDNISLPSDSISQSNKVKVVTLPDVSIPEEDSTSEHYEITRTKKEYLWLTPSVDVANEQETNPGNTGSFPNSVTPTNVVEDLKLQLLDLEKKFGSNLRYLEEQTVERELERDEFHQESQEFQRRLQELQRDRDHLQELSNNQKMELDELDQRLAEESARFESELAQKTEKLETDLKNSIDKIYELRGIIRDLEEHIDLSTANVGELRETNEILREELEKMIREKVEESLLNFPSISIPFQMDSIPNEILLQIIGCLEKQEIPKLRLVNRRFNQLSTTCLPTLFQVNFWNDSDIVKFISVFERKKTAVPFQKFGFSKNLSPYGQPLEEFCVQFGSIVKSWRILMCDPFDTLLYYIQFLFDKFENVEEIEYPIIVEQEMSKAMEIPVLKHLKTINIRCNDSTHEYDDSLLLKLLQKAPNLRNVSIDGNMYESDSPYRYHAFVLNILDKIYRINGPVLIQKLAVGLLSPALNMDELENFVAISTKHKILDLQLFLKFRDPTSGSASQTMEIISNWIQKLTSLRKLFLECQSTDDFGPITLPIRSLANIACLELFFPHEFFPHESIILRQPVEFPALTTLDCIYSGTTDKFIFAGCIFPNVKFAKIYLKTEQERQHWPLVLPNVTELCVVSETLEGIFQFPKVQKLHIYTESDTPGPDWDRDLQLKHWNHLTNGAQYISHSMITNSLLETGKTSESVDSFRNFPVLTHLKFLNCSIECWKGVIYASQTGQLRRLQKLVFDHTFVNEKEEYLEVLMKYHDSAITTAQHQHCIPPFLWNELFLD